MVRLALVALIFSFTLSLSGCLSSPEGDGRGVTGHHDPEIKLAFGFSGGNAHQSTGGNIDLGIVLNDTKLDEIRLFVKNISNAKLKIESSGVSGTNASDFTLDGLNAGEVIVVNGEANFSIRFSPTSIGNKSATMRLSIVKENGVKGSFSLELRGESLYGGNPPLPPVALKIAPVSPGAVIQNSCVPFRLSLRDEKDNIALLREANVIVESNYSIFLNNNCSGITTNSVTFEIDKSELLLSLVVNTTLTLEVSDIANNLESDAIMFPVLSGAAVSVAHSVSMDNACGLIPTGNTYSVTEVLTNNGDLTASNLNLTVSRNGVTPPIVFTENTCGSTLAMGATCRVSMHLTVIDGSQSDLFSVSYNTNNAASPTASWSQSQVVTGILPANAAFRAVACNLTGAGAVAKLPDGRFLSVKFGPSPFGLSILKSDGTFDQAITVPSIPAVPGLQNVTYIGFTGMSVDGAGNVYLVVAKEPWLQLLKVNPNNGQVLRFYINNLISNGGAYPLGLDVNTHGDVLVHFKNYMAPTATPFYNVGFTDRWLLRFNSSLQLDTGFNGTGKLKKDWECPSAVALRDDKSFEASLYFFEKEACRTQQYLKFSAEGSRTTVAGPFQPKGGYLAATTASQILSALVNAETKVFGPSLPFRQ